MCLEQAIDLLELKFVSSTLSVFANCISSQLIVTTDVQGASICRVEDTRTNLVQCSYVEGSDARGCTYTISAAGVQTANGTIARNNTVGMMVELVATSGYDELVLYDLENDGTTGTLPIIENAIFKIPMCNFTTNTVFANTG